MALHPSSHAATSPHRRTLIALALKSVEAAGTGAVCLKSFSETMEKFPRPHPERMLY
jgi:hypothetical protein